MVYDINNARGRNDCTGEPSGVCVQRKMLMLRNLIKSLLRLPADALIKSSRSFTERVEECLQHSPALATAIRAGMKEKPAGALHRSICM